MDRLAAMEVFVRVVETGSFSAAARQLQVGQPAISKTVAQLEARLGVQLLLRSTRGLAPTEAGLRFYERARRAIDEADEAESAARDASAALTGRLRFSAATTFARLHLIPLLPRFLAEHPALSIDAVLDDRSIDLIEAGVDLAIRMGALPDSGLAARKIGQGRRLVVATPAYLASHGVPKVPSDLAAHQAVMFDHASVGSTWTFSKEGAEASIAMRGRVRVSASEGLRAAVLADLGLAVASEWMFAPELASGTVEALLPDWSLPPLDLWAVYPSGRRASAKARAFASYVEASLQR